MAHRQKLIKLADSSELGWRVVTEYEANPLASDSDDEKRMYKAEARASKKIKAEKTKKGRTSNAWPYRKGANNASTTSTPSPAQSTRRPGLCFHCGKPGHWRGSPDCQANASKNKISINTSAIIQNNVGRSLASVVHCVEKTENGELKVITPVGRLKAKLEKWKEATDSVFIHDTVENGYKLPLKMVPERVILKNNKSARENMSFVHDEISNLLKTSVVTEVITPPHVVNPLTVAYNKKGKPRLVLDCRHINEYLHLFKVKFEDIKVAECMFDNRSFLYTFDLKGAYHHIDIYQAHRTFLGFSCKYNDKTRYFIFNSLPFGIKTAGHIFTKVMRVVVKFLRSKGHKVIMFLDDGIGGDASYEKAIWSSEFTKQTLLAFAFLLADEKCHWIPILRVTLLGHDLDMHNNRLYIAKDRIERLHGKVKILLKEIKFKTMFLIHVKYLANLIGQIVSMQSVFCGKTRLMTRYMYKCIDSRASWNAPVRITPEVITELTFWNTNLVSLNERGKPIKDGRLCSYSLFSDASGTGYGGYVEYLPTGGIPTVSRCINLKENFQLPFLSINEYESSNDVRQRSPEVDFEANCLVPEVTETRDIEYDLGTPDVDPLEEMLSPEADLEFDSEMVGLWSFSEHDESSTWREAESIYRIVSSYANVLQNSLVKVYCDNKNVISVLLNGSRISAIQNIAVNLNVVCDKENIVLCPEWIPRRENVKADYLSRCYDCDDWTIADTVYNSLDGKWGSHSIDRFASYLNTKCIRFNSRWWVPGTEAVDCFQQSWSNDINWLVPPPRLISKCIGKIIRERANSTLIVPKWKSAPFWPQLVNENGEFKLLVKDFVNLGRKNIISAGLGNNGCFAKTPLTFDMLALNLGFEDI